MMKGICTAAHTNCMPTYTVNLFLMLNVSSARNRQKKNTPRLSKGILLNVGVTYSDSLAKGVS